MRKLIVAVLAAIITIAVLPSDIKSMMVTHARP